MPDYLMRDIDPDLWRRVKSRAALDEIQIKQLILSLLARYADGELPRKLVTEAQEAAAD